MNHIRELWGARELLVNLTAREVKGKYRRTFFGQLWSLFNPLAMMVVYTIVFGVIFRAQPEPGDPSGVNSYPLWLMVGLLPWTFFSRTVSGSLASITANGPLIKKVYFPRMALPLSVAGAIGFTWLNEMALLGLILAIVGSFWLPYLPMLLLFMVLLALFASGIGMALAVLNVNFRDTQHFTAIALQLWLYLTPIIYPISLVEAAARTHGSWILLVYQLNPMYHFVEAFRNLIYDARLPSLSDALWCVTCALVAFAFGYLVFALNEKKFARML